MPVARLDYSLCENDKANMAYSAKVIRDIVLAAGAQDILTIQRFAHLVGGCRMGTEPAEQRDLDATISRGRFPTCSSPTAAYAPPREAPTRP